MRTWRALRGDLGFPLVTAHMIRRTVATRITELIGVEAAQRQLGHVESNTTKRFYVAAMRSVVNNTEVWDVREPAEPVFEVALPDSAVATLSPDGSTLAVRAGGRVLLLDTTTLDESGPALRGHVDDVQVAYSHDGSMLLSTSGDTNAVIWDTDTGAEQRRFVGHSQGIADGGFSPDDRTVYTGAGGELMAWDLTAESALMSVSEATAAAGSELGLSLPAPDGGTIARTAPHRLWFVDTRTGRETPRSRTRRTVWFHVWSPDSRWFLSVGPGVLLLWEPNTGRLVNESTYAERVGVLAGFSADGNRIHVHDRLRTVQTLDRATLAPVNDPVTVTVGVLHALFLLGWRRMRGPGWPGPLTWLGTVQSWAARWSRSSAMTDLPARMRLS